MATGITNYTNDGKNIPTDSRWRVLLDLRVTKSVSLFLPSK